MKDYYAIRSILNTSHMHFSSDCWENVLFKLGTKELTADFHTFEISPISIRSRSWLVRSTYSERLTISLQMISGRNYQLVGCFKDKMWPWRAIPYSGKTFSGSIAVQKCGEIAVANGYQAFGVQDGGECYTGPKAHETFNKYGQAKDSDCKNGVGGWYRNNIYSVCKSEMNITKPWHLLRGCNYFDRFLSFFFIFSFANYCTLSLQKWSMSNFSCSITRNITSHSMENLVFHGLLRWKMIIAPILTT